MTKPQQYKAEPHQFRQGIKVVSWQYCLTCGFVAMKNELSDWVMKQGCNHKDHPSWKNKLELTNPFMK